MNDVIWAAAIAAAVSGVGNWTTYLVSKRASTTAIATVEKQAEVELAKVTGELEKLRREHREAERSNRQGTYHRTLAILDRLDMFATGYNPEREEAFMEALEGLNNMVGGIRLFGATRVRDALAPLAEELVRLGEDIRAHQQDRTVTYAVAYGKAYRSRRAQILAATGQLTEAMRADVTHDILIE